MTKNAVCDFFRAPEEEVRLAESHAQLKSGYFRFRSPQCVSYGPSAGKTPDVLTARSEESLPDLGSLVQRRANGEIELPFDLATTVDNLRCERYPQASGPSLLAAQPVRRAYYAVRPLLGAALRSRLQRIYFSDWRKFAFPRWPLDTSVECLLKNALAVCMEANRRASIPFIWFWPEGSPAAAMVTHDVETESGLAGIPRLIEADEAFRISSAYHLVPEKRYRVPPELLGRIRDSGCEVGVHDLDHDGNLFEDADAFRAKAVRINRHLRDFHAEGFRAGCMYRNPALFHHLDASYDMSMPNVAHLEPQRGGCCTVFPFFVGRTLELPLTLVQDYTLFHILGDYSTGLWEEQIRAIIEQHGLISLITHPDYVLEPRALAVYSQLLRHLSKLRSRDGVWIAKPGEVNRWWRQRSKMRLVRVGDHWTIEGEGSERARIATAHIESGCLAYSLEPVLA